MSPKKIFTKKIFHPKKFSPKKFSIKKFFTQKIFTQTKFFTQIAKLFFVDLRWAQLYVSLVACLCLIGFLDNLELCYF